MVQTALVQDEALKRANARIEELQAQVGGEEQQRSGGFLDSMRDAVLGRSEPRGRPAAGVSRVQLEENFRSSELCELCKEVQKPTLSNRFKPYEPRHGFGSNIVALAVAGAELQEKRHAADYDVMI